MQDLLWSIKKIFFDNNCIVCGNKLDDKSFYLCYNCYNELKYTSSLKEIAEENLYYIWNYEGVFKQILWSYKFHSRRAIATIINELIKEKLKFLIEKENVDVIIPVPISKKRKIIRGFNQIEELLKTMDLKYTKIDRKKETRHMYSILNEQKRKENIKGSFAVNQGLLLDKKVIMIFDDVVTTGATAEEIKKEITKEYAPEKIITFSLTIAKYARYKRR